MLAQEEYLEAHALRKRGWSISAIARHLGRDRKTVRAHLSGERAAGQRRPVGPDPFEVVEAYVRLRLAEDPHLWATALFEEAKGLGYEQSYVTFARKVRERGLRPVCAACSGTRGRAVAIIDHPPGEEWSVGLAGVAGYPVGVNRVRAGGCPVLFGQVPGMGSVRARTRLIWWRASTRCCAASGARLGGGGWIVWPRWWCLAPIGSRPRSWEWPRHYGVGVDPCPPRRPNRKGVVEKAIHYISQRWWRTAAVTSLAEGQDSLDRFSQTVGDARRRAGGTVGELADAEPLLDLPPVPYPAEGTLERKVAANGLVSVWGNRYSVPPSVIGTDVSVRWRLGDAGFDVISASGRLIASHRTVPRGQGRVVRLPEHTAALEKVVLGAFTTARPCAPKPNRPPSAAALAIAADLGGSGAEAEPVIDLGVYQRHIDRQNRGRR